jgi:hypothetical protein
MKIPLAFFLLGMCIGASLPLARGNGVPSPRGTVAATWDEAYARMQPFRGQHQPGTDPSTLNGKVMCGYQGWFLAEGDGSGMGWVHYGHDNFGPGACTVDFWPDMSEAGPDERYDTPFHLPDGSVATVFSSYNAKTVDRHFKWMADYGIDGAFLQRFGTELLTPERYDHLNAVLDNVRRAANAHGRTWAVMYDLSGLEKGQIDSVIIADWKRLVDRMAVNRDPSYQQQNGKPVVAVWGVGFNEGRHYTLEECAHLIDFLKHDPKYGGNCVMLGVPYGWREQNRDAVTDPNFHNLIRTADIVSPWAVTRYASIQDFNNGLKIYAEPDLQWCRQNHLDYLPVIFPGFRWKNLMATRGHPNTSDEIDRLKGRFFEAQGRGLISAGVNMLYVAMFDEIDEGTAIFKCTNEPPGAPGDFGTFDGLPSDAYLKIAGEFSASLKKKELTSTAP